MQTRFFKERPCATGLMPILLVLCSVGISPARAADRAELSTDADKTSYSFGLEMARNFRKNGMTFDADLLMQGLKDGQSGARPMLREKEIRKVLSDFQNQARQRMAQNQRVQAADNRKRAEVFLAENLTKDGIHVMPNGVQYRVIKAGTGHAARDVDTVLVQYRGTLLDGTEFDATEPGQPGRVAVMQTIQGLKTTFQAMTTGAHWQVWIPPHLGYGERGVGQDIGPNEVLSYDIELLGVQAMPGG